MPCRIEFDAIEHHFLADHTNAHSTTTNIKSTIIEKADKRAHHITTSSGITPNTDTFADQSSNRVKQAAIAIGNANAEDYVPTGMEFFESLKQKNLYQTITLPPPVDFNAPGFVNAPKLPTTHRNRINSRVFIESDAETSGTTRDERTETHPIKPDLSNFYRGPSERVHTFDHAHAPKMIKFTLEDAVKRENIDYHNLTSLYGPGPVTMAPEKGPLFDARLIQTTQPDAKKVYQEIRELRGLAMPNEKMNLGELQIPSVIAGTSSPSASAHPPTIPAKLPQKKRNAPPPPPPAQRGQVKFGRKTKERNSTRKFRDIKFAEGTFNSNDTNDNWEPIGTAPGFVTSVQASPSPSLTPFNDADVEITREKVIEIPTELLAIDKNVPIIAQEHNVITMTLPKQSEHETNALEVSNTYTNHRSHGQSAESPDIVYGYGKPQHVPFVLNHPSVGRIPVARVTEYQAPSQYVPVRRHRLGLDRHPAEDVILGQAKRTSPPRTHSIPRGDISNYFQ